MKAFLIGALVWLALVAALAGLIGLLLIGGGCCV